jgi:hypothetical protein
MKMHLGGSGVLLSSSMRLRIMRLRILSSFNLTNQAIIGLSMMVKQKVFGNKTDQVFKTGQV